MIVIKKMTPSWRFVTPFNISYIHLLRKENHELPHFLNFCHVSTSIIFHFIGDLYVQISFEQNWVIPFFTRGCQGIFSFFLFLFLFFFLRENHKNRSGLRQSCQRIFWFAIYMISSMNTDKTIKQIDFMENFCRC